MVDKYGEPDWKDNSHIGATWKARYDLALSTDTPSHILNDLVYDKKWEVRAMATINPKTSQQTLVDVASHSSWMMRENVAKNPAVPLHVLEVLQKDPSEAVRKTASYRSKNRSSVNIVGRSTTKRNERTMQNDADDIMSFFDRVSDGFWLMRIITGFFK